MPPFKTAVEQRWYEDPANLAALYNWLEENVPNLALDIRQDVGLFLEKPWKWQLEWDVMQIAIAKEKA